MGLGNSAVHGADRVGLGQQDGNRRADRWLLQRWLSKRDKAVERGEARVDAAQPELVPTGNASGQYVVQLHIENRGRGTARTRRLGFTDVPEIPTRDEVPVGQARFTAGLNVQGSALFDPASNGQAEIRLVYVDRHDNEYRLLIPVTRQNRADGGFNMVMDWHHGTTINPKLSEARLREIGGPLSGIASGGKNMAEWKTLERIQVQQATQIDLREWLRMVAEGLVDVHQRLELFERETGLAKPKE